MELCSDCGKAEGIVGSGPLSTCAPCTEARIERYRKVVQAILNGRVRYKQSHFWNLHYIGHAWPLGVAEEFPELAARLIATENALAVLTLRDVEELYDVR